MRNEDFMREVENLIGRELGDETLTENFDTENPIRIEESHNYDGNTYYIYEDTEDEDTSKSNQAHILVKPNEYGDLVVVDYFPW